MTDFHIDQASGVRMIGAEMLFESERSESGSAAAVVDLTKELLAKQSATRVLLLGIRASMLLDSLEPDQKVDVLVRCLEDAREIAANRYMFGNLSVWCGGADRFDPPAKYDLIITLDDPISLLTPDSNPLETMALIERVATWVEDGGKLVCQISNGFSVETVSSIETQDSKVTAERIAYSQAPKEVEPPEVGSDDNGDWWRGAPGFPQRSPYWSEVSTVSELGGMKLTSLYAAYPTRTHPALLIDSDAVDELEYAYYIPALQAQTFVPEHQMHLVEPVGMLSGAIRAGQTVGLAPSWVLVFQNEASEVSLPALIYAELGMASKWRQGHKMTRDGDTFKWAPRKDGAAYCASDLLSREQQTEPTHQMGLLLNMVLRDELSSGNMSTLRELLVDYADWLEELSPKEAVFATPDNVLITSEGFSIFDTSWNWAKEVSHDVALTYCLRHFSIRLLRAGLPHPWRPELSPNEMALTLAGMAGRGFSKSVVSAAAKLDAAMQIALFDVPSTDAKRFASDAIAEGSSACTFTVVGGAGFKELATQSTRMSIALQTRTDQVAWLEKALENRSAKLLKTEKRLAHTRSSVSFRVGQVVTWPLRRPMHLFKDRMQSLIPTNLINKGIAALKQAASK